MADCGVNLVEVRLENYPPVSLCEYRWISKVIRGNSRSRLLAIILNPTILRLC